jgi:hypothetical protein
VICLQYLIKLEENLQVYQSKNKSRICKKKLNPFCLSVCFIHVIQLKKLNHLVFVMADIIDLFKDSSIWGSRTPYLPVCFRETILIWIPCIFICIYAIINYICLNHRSNKNEISFNQLNKYKFVCIHLN